LAEWAATAIENARLYEFSERRRHEAEQAVMGLRAARDIADAIAGAEDLDRVLELIVKRGRALVDARAVLILLRDGDELVVSAAAGQASEAHGQRVPIGASTSGQVLERGRPERVADASRHLRIAPDRLGVPDAHTALLVPMLHRGNRVGVLAAFDRGPDAAPFSLEHEQLLRSFASSAANAVTIHRSVEADRLRSAITAADAERSRWARELHDQTLQALGGLRVLLASGLRRSDPDTLREAVRQAVEEIELEIDNLRAIITDLRPSLLDDLGLMPAIEALVDRRRHGGLNVVSELALPADVLPLDPELETTVYRFIQEALTNTVKHAQASLVKLSVTASDGAVVLAVSDNGVGFDPALDTDGFGLAGMRERVYLAGGTLEITSDQSGTVVSARLPIRSGADESSHAHQVAS
jgi:signal transduction histidine kinase